MRRCVEAINKMNRGEASEEDVKLRQQKAMQDPEIQLILSDPITRQVGPPFLVGEGHVYRRRGRTRADCDTIFRGHVMT